MAVPAVGTEWLVDALGCPPEPLRSLKTLQELFARIADDLGLRTVAAPLWHVFPGEGGITGLQLLAASHLTCHTAPEHGHAAFNLYSCRPRPDWPWAERLRESLGAREVTVRRLTRGEK